jgi:hypothetical protein
MEKPTLHRPYKATQNETQPGKELSEKTPFNQLVIRYAQKLGFSYDTSSINGEGCFLRIALSLAEQHYLAITLQKPHKWL